MLHQNACSRLALQFLCFCNNDIFNFVFLFYVFLPPRREKVLKMFDHAFQSYMVIITFYYLHLYLLTLTPLLSCCCFELCQRAFFQIVLFFLLLYV